jgi:hypothetical protein
MVLGNKSHEKLGTLTDSAHVWTVCATTADSPDRGPSGLRAGLSARPFWLLTILSAFRDRGVPEPTSEVLLRAPAQMGRHEAEREGGEARWPEMGVREVEIPRPSCSSRAQVGCACSRGLQASTRGKERVASRERPSRPRPRAANLL